MMSRKWKGKVEECRNGQLKPNRQKAKETTKRVSAVKLEAVNYMVRGKGIWIRLEKL